jgi:hypothetical protein
MFFLHLIDFLSELIVLVLDSFYAASDYNFLTIDTVLVVLMEISFLSQLFPGRLSVISDNLGLA